MYSTAPCRASRASRSGTGLAELEGSSRPLSDANADAAQVAFSVNGTTLVVTERATDSISAFAVDERGSASGQRQTARGQTPYGCGFTTDGALVVTEAFAAAPGAAATSSYVLTEPGRLSPVSASVGNTRSEVCWAIVTNDGRFAFVTNFGDGTISSYAIAGDGSIALYDPVADTTRLGKKGIRDAAIPADGRYLYAIETDAQRVFGWSVSSSGELASIGVRARMRLEALYRALQLAEYGHLRCRGHRRAARQRQGLDVVLDVSQLV